MIGAIVQARMSSTRLPGKALRPLAGRPVLGHLVDRLRRATLLEALVVATSDDRSDDPVAAFCGAEGVRCHRGALDDVAARMLAAAATHDIDPIVRISGDSPLLDPVLVDRAVALWQRGGADLVTNVAPRSFPTGQSVEVFAAGTLRGIYPAMDAADREHVTRRLYATPDVRVRNFASGRALGALRLSVDTAQDATTLDAVVTCMERPPADYGVDELVALLRETGA